MHNHKKEYTHNRIKSYHFDKLKEPIKVELDKKFVNPETNNLDKFQYMPREHQPQKLEEYIRSPLQKDQFLYGSKSQAANIKTCPSAVQTLSSESLNSKNSA